MPLRQATWVAGWGRDGAKGATSGHVHLKFLQSWLQHGIGDSGVLGGAPPLLGVDGGEILQYFIHHTECRPHRVVPAHSTPHHAPPVYSRWLDCWMKISLKFPDFIRKFLLPVSSSQFLEIGYCKLRQQRTSVSTLPQADLFVANNLANHCSLILSAGCSAGSLVLNVSGTESVRVPIRCRCTVANSTKVSQECVTTCRNPLEH